MDCQTCVYNTECVRDKSNPDASCDFYHDERLDEEGQDATEIDSDSR